MPLSNSTHSLYHVGVDVTIDHVYHLSSTAAVQPSPQLSGTTCLVSTLPHLGSTSLINISSDIQLLYSRLLADVNLANSFCTQYLASEPLSRKLEAEFGTECDLRRDDLTTGCSLFRAASQLFQSTQPTVTVTVTEPIATPIATHQAHNCTRQHIKSQKEAAPAPPNFYLTPTPNTPGNPRYRLFNEDVSDQRALPALSSLTATKSKPLSLMTRVFVSSIASSTLSATTPASSPLLFFTSPTPARTAACIPTAHPPAADYHVFEPLIDLVLVDPSTVIAATTVSDPQDANAENCSPYASFQLPKEPAGACLRMKGSWTPRFANVYYECISRTRAPDFDPMVVDSTTGFNFSSSDNSFSMSASRQFGRRPEKKYRQSSMLLYTQQDKSYEVDFWACGSGGTVLVSELSCTYFGDQWAMHEEM